MARLHPLRWSIVLVAQLGLWGCAGSLPTMRVHFVDVGQGDATLLEFPCAAVLIDTGGEENDSFSGQQRLAAYLGSFFERRKDLEGQLELLVLTHAHVDHTRGTKWVLERYAPRHLVTNGLEVGSGRHGQIAAHRYAERASAGRVPVRLQRVRTEEISPGGLTSDVIDPIHCDGVDPELRVLWGAQSEARNEKNGNNHSIVLKIDFGRASVLFTGDLETKAIEELLALHQHEDVLVTDVYQVGHHGSRNGTTPQLLRAMKPKIAVVSMGRPARQHMWTAWAFGHPSKSVVEQLERAVSTPIESRQVQVGVGAKRFEPVMVARAVYATGWDGDLVFEATLDGTWTVQPPN